MEFEALRKNDDIGLFPSLNLRRLARRHSVAAPCSKISDAGEHYVGLKYLIKSAACARILVHRHGVVGSPSVVGDATSRGAGKSERIL